jgi:branched-chain amino acid transport system substrate-binding protein
VSYINSQGGLDCHPVKYIVVDDGNDPSRNQSLTQQLVEQDHAIAFVAADAPVSGQGSVSYLTQHQIPVIGSETASPWFYQSPLFFPQASSGPLLSRMGIVAPATVARGQGLSRLGLLYCVEAAICSSIASIAPAAAAQAGINLVYSGAGSVVQPDYTSNCLAAQKAGAQVLVMSFDSNSIGRIVRSCSGVNFRPMYATAVSAANIGFASNPLLAGLVLAMPVLPWFVTSNPSIALFHKVLAQYAPGQQPDPGLVVGWVSAMMLRAAARNLPDQPTSQALLQGLYGLKGDDLGGITIPLNFTPGQIAPATFCYWIAQIENGTWVTPNGGARICP